MLTGRAMTGRPSRNRRRSSASPPPSRSGRPAPSPGTQADRLQVLAQAGHQGGRPRRRRVSDPTWRAVSLRVALAERRAAGEQFVQDGPEGVHVGRPGPMLASARRLLRGHVARRAEDGAGRRVSPVPASAVLRQPEVGDLRRAVRPSAGCSRLQVAVDDPWRGRARRLGPDSTMRPRRSAGGSAAASWAPACRLSSSSITSRAGRQQYRRRERRQCRVAQSGGGLGLGCGTARDGRGACRRGETP